MKRGERAEILGHGPAPEPDVDEGGTGRGVALDLQGIGGGGGRDGVERHIDDGRHATGRRRESGRMEPFPLGATRFVDVHVGVHESGQQNGVIGEPDDVAGEFVGGTAGVMRAGKNGDLRDRLSHDVDARGLKGAVDPCVRRDDRKMRLFHLAPPQIALWEIGSSDANRHLFRCCFMHFSESLSDPGNCFRMVSPSE